MGYVKRRLNRRGDPGEGKGLIEEEAGRKVDSGRGVLLEEELG